MANTINLFFCELCGRRIPPADIDGGVAKVTSEVNAICFTCHVPQAVPVEPLPNKPRETVLHVPEAVPGVIPRRTGRPTVKNSPPARNASATEKPIRVEWIAAGVISALAFCFLMYKVLGGTTKPTDIKIVQDKRPDTVVKDVPRNPANPATPTNPTPSNSIATTPSGVGSTTKPPETTVPVPPKKTEDDEYDPRASVSALLLTQAKAYIKSNPGEVFSYKDQLERIKEGYRGTPAEKEATILLSEIKLPPTDPDTNPPPTPDSAWAKAIQVLQSVDPSKDRIAGNWSYTNSALRSDQQMWSRCALPYILPEEYDVRVTFARVVNEDCLLIILSRHGRPFIFSIGSGNMHCSLEDIKSKENDLLPLKTKKPGILSNGQRAQVVVQVRKKCIRAYLNGKPIVGALTEDDGISLAKEMQNPQAGQMGFASWNSVFEFYSAEILELKGQGKFLR